ncbi:hypothetical protein SAMN04489725_11011 [Alicyclobacillus hesperidum]|uniref:Uncharacterized protein n=1 Tax=Alicyclobacillus hesperidum TaxID=89784 RepID=A0A1H2V663_9BACL|nr:hypothetical protein [Alicyclobacillus hesperidum]SDW63838.1 hypothetical protein SAMN04489725_11011 [Alicyclobacillus hesperidum]
MTDVRVVRVEYENENSLADEWIQRLVEHLLIVKLELAPKDVANFLMSTRVQEGDPMSGEEV